MEQIPDWKKKLCYSTPMFEKHTVRNVEQHYYPVSPGLLFKLRRTAKEVTKAISDIFANVKNDFKTVDQTVTNKTTDGIERTVVVEPISLQIAEYRDNQRAKAWQNAIESITSEDTLQVLAEIIMDSLKEVFPEGTPKPTPEEFLAFNDLPTLSQHIFGVAKANKDVLGPLAKTVGSSLSKLENLVNTKVDELTVKAKDSPAA